MLQQIKAEAVSRFNVTIEYCIENWSCMDWSACEGGVQTRTCTDLNNCGTEESKPPESQLCTVEPVTGPNVGGGGGGGGIAAFPSA